MNRSGPWGGASRYDWLYDYNMGDAEGRYYRDQGERPPGMYNSPRDILQRLSRAELYNSAGHSSPEFVDPPQGYPGGAPNQRPDPTGTLLDYIRYMYEMNPNALRNLFYRGR